MKVACLPRARWRRSRRIPGSGISISGERAAAMLRVTDLAVSYGARSVLRGVNLSVEANQIVAVIGRNAVGKTTLLKAIVGMLPILSGSISLAAEDITRLPAYHRARRGLGYVPQGRMI